MFVAIRFGACHWALLTLESSLFYLMLLLVNPYQLVNSYFVRYYESCNIMVAIDGKAKRKNVNLCCQTKGDSFCQYSLQKRCAVDDQWLLYWYLWSFFSWHVLKFGVHRRTVKIDIKKRENSQGAPVIPAPDVAASAFLSFTSSSARLLHRATVTEGYHLRIDYRAHRVKCSGPHKAAKVGLRMYLNYNYFTKVVWLRLYSNV